VTKKKGAETYTEENCDVQFDAVVTIAPRQDVANTDSDIPEAMVTCICQVGLNKGNWQKGECSVFFISFPCSVLLLGFWCAGRSRILCAVM
jgi:hypothetical protein